MANAFTNFLRNKTTKQIAGEWTKRTADAIDAFNDPNERKVTINDIKLASPEKFITTHNYIVNMKNIIMNKEKIHYGNSSPIKPSQTKGGFLEKKENIKNVIDPIIELITTSLDEIYEEMCLYQSKKTNLEIIYNNTKEFYKKNKLYFDTIKILKISKIEDIDLLLSSNSFSEASRELSNSRLSNFKVTAIKELNKAISICIEQLKKFDQIKISEYNNISYEIKVLIQEIDSTKVLNNIDNSTLNLCDNIENSEKKCNQLLKIFSYKLDLLNKQKKQIKSKEEYKINTIFLEKTLPKLYKFYTDKFNKIKKCYQSCSGVFSQFKDSILFRNIIGSVSNINFVEETDANTKQIKTFAVGTLDELKIDNYKSDKKLPKLYSKYQDSYNFLFGNKNKYTGRYKNNISVNYDTDIHAKWSEFKTNSNNIKEKIQEYFKKKENFLCEFTECNKSITNLKSKLSKLIEQKNTLLMVKYRLPLFGSRETQKLITISLKGPSKYGNQNHMHIGYFFAYIYYIYVKLSEKNFSLLDKLLNYNSLQPMKNAFDTNNFEESLLSKIKSKLN